MRVMIADQDAAYRQVLVAQLQHWGYETQEVLAAQAVLDQCRKKCPDLIFIDSLLSGVSAIDMVTQIRQTGGHALWVPIILMGTLSSVEAINQGIAAGVDDILSKPLAQDKLALRVHAAQRLLKLKEEVFKVAHDLVLENRSLQSVITRDALTGLNNSNSLEQALAHGWKHWTEHPDEPLSFILFNLDFFQAYNQAYGALMGDETLKKVADLFKTQMPVHGVLARTTGETFAILVPNTNQEAAFKLGDSVRLALEQLAIPHAQSGCSDHLTLSFGLATAGAPGITYANLAEFKDAADFALYQAKHQGRNRGIISTAQ